jgi:hypothetical protein
MGRPKKEVVKEEEKPEIQLPEQFANPTGISLDSNNVKAEITEKDKEQFFKSFISDSVFSDESLLFDGKIKVVFNSITVDQNNDVLKQINLDEISGVANNTESYLLTIMIYRLALSLDSIDGFPFDTKDIDKATFQIDKDKPYCTYVKAKADKFKNWRTYKLAAFIKSFMLFENKLFQLERAVIDPNFWKAAE